MNVKTDTQHLADVSMLSQREKTGLMEKSFKPQTTVFFSIVKTIKTSRSLYKHSQKASEPTRKSQVTKKTTKTPQCAEDDLLVKMGYKLNHWEPEIIQYVHCKIHKP